MLCLIIQSGCALKNQPYATETPHQEASISMAEGAPLVPEAQEKPAIAIQKPAPSLFLQGLSPADIEQVKAEAKRALSPIWQRIDERSYRVRFRVIQALDKLNAPHELLYVPVAESGYNPYALSPAGAFGLWQLMPKTAIELGAKNINGLDGRRHIEASTKAAATYLLSLHDRFESWTLAICAYNLGPWGVQRRLNKTPWSPDMGLDALPFPGETRHYVKQILGMIALEQDGEFQFSEALATQNVHISAPVDLNQMEKVSGLAKYEIFRLNPAFDYQHYLHYDVIVHLPKENAERLQEALRNNPDIFKPKYINIKVESGDSLWKLAKRYHTSIKHLQHLNPQLSGVLSIGKRIKVPASDNVLASSSKANPLLAKGRRIRYKVRSGDSLWTIAKKFGTSTHAITRINQISANQLLRPGDRLWIIARYRPS
ncbi:MAG: LysM peptidoglycan-binding domain-containing protein [Ghiorsea sp.]|nr:LysM peptidoglycan-binding domain-containing protein [Ghiorsea sp.]